MVLYKTALQNSALIAARKRKGSLLLLNINPSVIDKSY